MKPLEEYGIRSYGRTGNKREYRNDCKVCWTKETKVRQKLRKENLHTMPSEDTPCTGCLISPKERMNRGMFTSPVKKIKTLWVCEHNHKTGKFRGWICDYCNTVIGRAGENPATLRRLADYIEESDED